MNNISYIANDTGLATVVNDVARQYYLRPFSGEKKDLYSGPIARHAHGILHVVRAACYIPHLDQLWEYTPRNHEQIINLLEFDSYQEFLGLVQVAMLLHDSARKNEGIDYWDAESAVNFVKYIEQHEHLSLSEKNAVIFQKAMEFKDNKQEYISWLKKLGFNEEEQDLLLYILYLIHDADCIDVIRARSKFMIEYLEIIKYAQYNNVVDIQDYTKALTVKAQELIFMMHDYAYEGASNLVCASKVYSQREATEYFRENQELIKRDYEYDRNLWIRLTGIFDSFVIC